MSYIDGFLIPVTAANKDAYRIMATKSAALLKELKALSDLPFDGKRMVYGSFEPLLDV